MANQEPKRKRRRRKKLLVDLAVQGHLVRHVLFQWFGFLVATAFILVSIEMLIGNPSGDLSHVRRQHFPILLAITILAPLFIMDLLRFSHRFVGPIVRLRREMKDLANGKFNPPISFREGDYWKDLSDNFNRISDKLRMGSQVELDRLEADVEASDHSSDELWNIAQDEPIRDHEVAGAVAAVPASTNM